MLQNIDFAYLINASIGILFSLIIGFFILKAILSAIAFATDYEGKKETLEQAKKSLTSAVKGVIIALGTFIFLNFILSLLGIAPIENPGKYIQRRLDEMYICLYNYSLCGLPGVDIDNLPPNLRYAIDPYNFYYIDRGNPTYLSSYDHASDPDRLRGATPPLGDIIRPKTVVNGIEEVTANYFAVYTYGRSTHHFGLSQWGARARDEDGKTYRDIINFYYKSDIIKPETCYGGKIKMNEVKIDVTGGPPNLEIEKYVEGIHGEMPSYFGPEALRAQAIAARSYVLYKTECGNKSICSSESCQVYRASNCPTEWCDAVRETAGMVIKENMGANFQYSAYSGGYVYPGGFDYVDKENPQWPEDANEKKVMDAYGAGPSFYATWVNTRTYGPSIKEDPCGVHSTYLSQEQWADFANAHDIYEQTPDDKKSAFLQKILYKNCGYPYSKDALWRDSPNKHNRVTSIILHRDLKSNYTPARIAINSKIVMKTDIGEVKMTVEAFRAIYNVRAPGSLSISSNIVAFEGRN